MTVIFFNLLANACMSLIIGLVVVGIAMWLFRIPTGSYKIALWSIPFVKIIFDIIRGIPPDSVLWSGIDPFALPRHSQLLRVGAGISPLGPVVSTSLSVQDLQGHEYAASLGDYLLLWINRTFGHPAAKIIVATVLLISLFLVTRRLYGFLKFEFDRIKNRPQGRKIEFLEGIDVYSCNKYVGTPFTGGIFKPYICVPESTLASLTANELQSVLAHELAHIKKYDLIFNLVIGILGDMFWYLPFYKWLSRKLDRLRELTADRWAVQSGACPSDLAAALVKVQLLSRDTKKVLHHSAFFREKSLLVKRVEKLLGTAAEAPGRFGWNNGFFRSAVALLIFVTVMLATFGGNQTVKIENAKWINEIKN